MFSLFLPTGKRVETISSRKKFLSRNKEANEKKQAALRSQSQKNKHKDKVNAHKQELQQLLSKVLNLQTWLRKRQSDLRQLITATEKTGDAAEKTFQALVDACKGQYRALCKLVEYSLTFLKKHRNIALEVNLDNLVFQWYVYIENLRKLQKLRGYRYTTLNIDTTDKLSIDEKVCSYSGSEDNENLVVEHVDSNRRDDDDTIFDESTDLLERLTDFSELGIHSKPDLKMDLSDRESSPHESSYLLKMSLQAELAKKYKTGETQEVKNPSDAEGNDFDALHSEAKRRKIHNDDTPTCSTVSSRSESPCLSECLDDSMQSSPGSSPMGKIQGDFRKRYQKHEIWSAIESDYEYLMDKEIIEACKNTESDLSLSDDPLINNHNISFSEFLQQYHELVNWLNHIQQLTQKMVTSHAEKYLNQSFHEEMLERSPRWKMLNEYARQLLLRHPHMKNDVNTRLQYLNGQWQTVEQAVSPTDGAYNVEIVLKELDEDLWNLREWIQDMERKLLSLHINPNWTVKEIESQLKNHQVLQRDIESHSKVISAVLKLSDRLANDPACKNDCETGSQQHIAQTLERRWHRIWLQSLEWQCRLEEGINKQKGNSGCLYSFDFLDDFSPVPDYNSEELLVYTSSEDSLKSPCLSQNTDCYRENSPNSDPAYVSAEVSDLDLTGSEAFSLSLNSSADGAEGIEMRKVRTSQDVGYGSASNDETSVEVEQKNSSSAQDPASLIENINIPDMVQGYKSDISRSQTSESVILSGQSYSSNPSSDIESSDKCDIKFLIDQAEILVRENSPKRLKPKISSECRKRKLTYTLTEPIPIIINSPSHNVESSCDASSEEDRDSDGSGEFFSTASDDCPDLFDSVISLDYPSDSYNVSRENITTLKPHVDTVKLRTCNKVRDSKDRPWSVVDMSESKMYSEFKPLFMSESAIDRLDKHPTDFSTGDHTYHATFPRRKSKNTHLPRSLPVPDQSSTNRKVPSTDDESDNRCYDRRDVLSNSSGESDSSGSYHTAECNSDADISEEEIEAEDPLNSTGSFSESAWDNTPSYLYHVSDSASEEPLEYEPAEMEFDIELEESQGYPLLKEAITKNSHKKKKYRTTTRYEDSDSDIEDLVHILDQSHLALKTTEKELKKTKNDDLGTGIRLKPTKYEDLHEMCKINLTCLHNVQQHLRSASEEDFAKIQDLISQWMNLESRVIERKDQSQELTEIAGHLNEIQMNSKDIAAVVKKRTFDDAGMLEKTTDFLMDSEVNVREDMSKMDEIIVAVKEFSEKNREINMQQFCLSVADCSTTILSLKEKISSRFTELRAISTIYNEFKSTQMDLEYLLAEDRKCLQMMRKNGCDPESMIEKAKIILLHLPQYEEKMETLENSKKKIFHVFTNPTELDINTTLEQLRHQLFVTKKECLHLMEALEEQLSSDEELERKVVLLKKSDAKLPDHARERPIPGWVKNAPISIAAAFSLAGLYFLVDPNAIENLANFSIRFAPELKYVDGPPPL